MSIDDNNLSITIGFPASPAPPNEISFDEVAGMIGSGKIVSKFTLLSFCLCIGLFEVLPSSGNFLPRKFAKIYDFVNFRKFTA